MGKFTEEGNMNPSHTYQFDAGASRRCLKLLEQSHVSRRAPEEQHKEIPATPATSWLL